MQIANRFARSCCSLVVASMCVQPTLASGCMQPDFSHAKVDLRSPGGNNAYAVEFGDLNHDGLSDLVVANFAENTIGIRLRQTRGPWYGQEQRFLFAPNAFGMTVADINGDGSNDIAAFLGTGMIWASGQGDGTVSFPLFVPLGSNLRDALVADINQDGHLDLIGSDASGSLERTLIIRLGAGGGTFTTAVTLGQALMTTVAQQLITCDTNGDHLIDIALMDHTVSVNSDRVVAVILGGPNASFGPVSTTIVESGFSPIGLVDIDGDGRDDLALDHPIATEEHSRGIYWRASDGISFDSNTQLLSATFASVSNVANNDLDDDGRNDIIVTDNFNAFAWTKTGLGGSLLLDDGLQNSGAQLTLSDFDNDGDIDLFLHDHLRGVFHLWEGEDGFDGRQIENSGPAQTIVATDLDLDGDTDFVTMINDGVNEWTLTILRADTVGEYHATSHVISGFVAFDLYSADLNGDGIGDYMIGAIGEESGMLMGLSDGAGGFIPPMFISIPYQKSVFNDYALHFATADFDHDGFIDIVALTDSDAHILRGIGGGRFLPSDPIDFPEEVEPFSAMSMDADNDGNPDVLFVGGEGGIGVLYGTGEGSFLPPQLIPSSMSFFYSLRAADVTGDCKTDLIAGGVDGGVLFESDLAGNWFESLTWSNDPVNSLEAKDLTGDGVADIAFYGIVSGLTELIITGPIDGTECDAVWFGGYSRRLYHDVTGDGLVDRITAGGGMTGVPISVSVNQGVPRCAGDLDGDGEVSSDDLNALLSRWGEPVDPGCPLNANNMNDVVDVDDLNVVLANFGVTCS
ncbi:MAG: VCBS repeat-containing protein [Phycisphaeraceae bacterium]|nr:VCBS repeat-containing protein [Phycisphaeraceae bacterium]